MQCRSSPSTLWFWYIAVIVLWSTREIHNITLRRGRGRSTGCHSWVQNLTKVTKDTYYIEHLASRLHMSTGLRILAYHLYRLSTSLKPSPRLPSDHGNSWHYPDHDQSHVGTSFGPDVFGTVWLLSRRFHKHSRSCRHYRSLRDCCRRCGSIEDTSMYAPQFRQVSDSVSVTKLNFRTQILLWTEISPRNICLIP